jgi:hypothetical protein
VNCIVGRFYAGVRRVNNKRREVLEGSTVEVERSTEEDSAGKREREERRAKDYHSE